MPFYGMVFTDVRWISIPQVHKELSLYKKNSKTENWSFHMKKFAKDWKIRKQIFKVRRFCVGEQKLL